MTDLNSSSNHHNSNESGSLLPSIHEAQSLDYSLEEESTATGNHMRTLNSSKQVQKDQEQATSNSVIRPLTRPNPEQDEDPNTRAERLNALRMRSISDKSLLGPSSVPQPPVISESADEQPSNSPSNNKDHKRSLSNSTEGETESAPSLSEAQSPSPSLSTNQSALVSPPLRDILRKIPSGSSAGSDESTPSTTPVSSLHMSTGLSRRRNATVASPGRDELVNESHNTFQEKLYSPPPSSKRQGLSDASRMFDRDGKGYLDSTERALRSMDTDNDGQLNINQIYFLMKSLQHSQETSNELVHSLQKEQRKAYNLKWGIVFLAILAILLSMANIGTAFAAAHLAKDTQVQSRTGDLVDKSSGQRVGVTNKIKEITAIPIQEEQRRELSRVFKEQRRVLMMRDREMYSVIGYGNETYEDNLDEYELEEQGNSTNSTEDYDIEGTTTTTGPTTTTTTLPDLDCEEDYSYIENGEEVVVRSCASDAILTYKDTLDIYRSFCPPWQPNGTTQSPCTSQDGGVDLLWLTCNGKINRLYADPFPRGGPFVYGSDPAAPNFIFPGNTVNGTFSRYYGEQYLIDWSVGSLCTQQFSLSIVCLAGWDYCWTIGHFAGNRCPQYAPGLNADVKFSLCDPF